MDWGSLLSGIGSLAGGIYQANASTKAAKIAAASAEQARAQQLAQFNTLQSEAQPQITAGQNAAGTLSTALGLNGATAQNNWTNQQLSNSAFTTANQFALAKTQAQLNATGASPMGGNAASTLNAQSQSNGLNYIQQQETNLQGLETAGNQAISATAYPMATLGVSAGNAAQNAGNSLASGVTSSADYLMKGLGSALGSTSNLFKSSTAAGGGSGLSAA